MTALGEWLKQLVLLVILAALTDMLLPTKSMQKYVRMVMGLAIIAAILQPVVPYFHRDWADKAAQAAMAQLSGSSSSAPVVPDGQDYQKTLAAQEDEMADQMVATQLKDYIQEHFSPDTLSVTVTGASQGGSDLHVAVQIGLLDLGKRSDIVRAVTEELGVRESQVSVSAGGGGTEDGF